MSKTRTAATIALAAAAALALAACGTTHRAAVPESVVVSRPNTPAADGWTTSTGEPLPIQEAMRGHAIVTAATKTAVWHTDVPEVVLAGSRNIACPLPPPLTAAAAKKAVSANGVADVAWLSLPPVERASVTMIAIERSATTAQDGAPSDAVAFLVRGVRIGSPTARTERYRVGPDEPGLLLEDRVLNEVRGRWQLIPQETFPSIVTETRC